MSKRKQHRGSVHDIWGWRIRKAVLVYDACTAGRVNDVVVPGCRSYGRGL